MDPDDDSGFIRGVNRSVALVFLIACSSPSTDAPPGNGADAPATGDAPNIGDAPTSAACTDKMPQPLDATWTIPFGGMNRAAKVHVPASYDPAARTPLVLNIHGRTHNASGQATLSHAIAKSNAAGFIVVHPESATSPTSWNAGTCCDPASGSDLDDVGFISVLLDELESRLCVDPARIFSMGLSNGAYLSHTLACQVADRFTSRARARQRGPCP